MAYNHGIGFQDVASSSMIPGRNAGDFFAIFSTFSLKMLYIRCLMWYNKGVKEDT